MRDRQFKLDHRRAPGLVGLWGPGPPGGLLDYDMSGRGHDGTLAPAPTWVADPEWGWVLDFDGDKVIATPPIISTPLTLCAWAMSRDVTAVQSIMWLGDSTDPTEYWEITFNGNVAGDPFRAHVYTASSVRAEGGAYVANSWYHVCGVFAAVNSQKLYIDGQPVDSNVGGARDPTNVDRFTIGYRDDSTPTAPLDGQVSDARIYDRALSDAEIQHIFQTTKPEPYSDIRMRPRRVHKAAAAGGLSIPIAMHHYKQMMGA